MIETNVEKKQRISQLKLAVNKNSKSIISGVGLNYAEYVATNKKVTSANHSAII